MQLTRKRLSKYSSPYVDWAKPFIDVMNELEHFTGSNDEFFVQLLDELLPFVKHEYTIYDSIFPTLDCFSEIVLKSSTYLEEMVFFLDYVFQAIVRDKNQILVDPAYRYLLAPHLTAPTPDERRYFQAFQTFYGRHRGLLTDIGFQARYDVLLMDASAKKPAPPLSGNLTKINWLLARGLARFKQGQSLILDDLVEPDEGEFEDIVLAIQGKVFSSSRLFDLLRDDTTASTFWVGGRVGVIAGLLLFLRSQSSSVGEQDKTLKAIVEQCVCLKEKFEEEQIDQLSTDQFLLEDISTILFREYLGATTKVDLAALNHQQKAFLDLMENTYRGHTYSLLYAGVAPSSLTSIQIERIQNIYSLNGIR